MNTSFGNLTLAAALAAFPLTSVAQNIASGAPTVSRDIGRLTLLPGPKLLSPARGAPQSGEFISIMPAELVNPAPQPVFRFVPAEGANAPSQPGKPAPRAPFKTQDLTPSPVKKTTAPPRPEAEGLRFDAELPTPSTKLKDAGRPAPQR